MCVSVCVYIYPKKQLEIQNFSTHDMSPSAALPSSIENSLRVTCIIHTLIHSILLYCTVMYCTVLHYTVHYSTVQYNTLQYCTILYYIVNTTQLNRQHIYYSISRYQLNLLFHKKKLTIFLLKLIIFFDISLNNYYN